MQDLIEVPLPGTTSFFLSANRELLGKANFATFTEHNGVECIIREGGGITRVFIQRERKTLLTCLQILAEGVNWNTLSGFSPYCGLVLIDAIERACQGNLVAIPNGRDKRFRRGNSHMMMMFWMHFPSTNPGAEILAVIDPFVTQLFQAAHQILQAGADYAAEQSGIAPHGRPLALPVTSTAS
jgi:hypothetical protein